ncbi:MAG: lipid A biosynthesis protein [Candidatus Omnitrophota bacterium]|jgi:lipid-A-disaccharide synthase-like uncharacterized protein|nr:MAG: lipid A biosynthesis protein [Candidatus Omnitrophota bacterium]
MGEKFSEILANGLGFWALIGFSGQAIFASRFIIQWIESERRKESVIPIMFWYLSIVGSLLTLAYAFHKEDPVFIVGYLFNCIIYFRNLYFIYTKKVEATGE